MRLIFALFALLSLPGLANNNAHNQNQNQGQLVSVDAYMDVNSADCYDTTHNVVELANGYAANQQVLVNLHLVNQNHADIVRFQRNVAFRADRNVRVVLRRNVAARNQVIVRNRFVGNRVVLRRGNRVVFNRVGAFNRQVRQGVQVRFRF